MSSHDQKHLTIDQRIIIQTGIANRSLLKHIASTIGKDPTTVKKEIPLHHSNEGYVVLLHVDLPFL